MDKKCIGIIGASGYTGSELVRILVNHPHAEIAAITSEARAGRKFSDVHSFFRGIVDLELIPSERIDEARVDLVFLALPHGVAMDFVKKYRDRPFKIVDLSGDFRLGSPSVYEDWYQKEHIYPEGFEAAVFGLPELFHDEISGARLVANPGCYPTGAILGIAPLLSHGLVKPGPIIVDSKSGVTGAGVSASMTNHFCNVNDNFKAYNLSRHRHTIEIQGTLDRIAGKATSVQFTPHLLPVDRGILSTIYAHPYDSQIKGRSLTEVYADFYANAPYIRLCEKPPSIKDVRGTNYCDIHVTHDDRTGMIIIVSVIDNLVKGAAGQAVQNMNIMFGRDETEGLHQIPMCP